jgi:light-regulated signal transduction histidine kinase (bacteriophytochrome)
MPLADSPRTQRAAPRRSFPFIDRGASPRSAVTGPFAEDMVRDREAELEIENAQLRDQLEQRRERTAELEAVNEQLEAFSYSVAHDLRAPLRSIFAYSQVLHDELAHRLESGHADYLAQIRSAALRMGYLIDGLLELARVSRAPLQRAQVDVSALARLILARLRAAHPERGVEIVIQDGLGAHADPALLDVVLTNLLGNAWKFTSKRPRARIEVGAVAGDSPTTYFVRDNGAGFEPAQAERLFGVFQRLHAVQEFDGTGIGLATVQRVISRHGGKVWAEGALHQGATIYFTLEPALH